MKNFLLPFLLFTVSCFAQKNSLNQTAALFPLYIVDGIIANEAQLTAFKPTEILSVSIYKSDQLPDQLSPFVSFSSEGIIEITLKTSADLPTVLISELNMEHGLKQSNPVYLNRILLKNNDVKILKSAVTEAEIIEDSGQQFLKVWTLTQEERRGMVIRTGGIKSIPKNAISLKNVLLK